MKSRVKWTKMQTNQLGNTIRSIPEYKDTSEKVNLKEGKGGNNADVLWEGVSGIGGRMFLLRG